MRSKIRVFFRLCPMICFDTKKYARKVYSLSLSDAKAGRKKRGPPRSRRRPFCRLVPSRFSRSSIRRRHGRDGCEGTYILTRKRS